MGFTPVLIALEIIIYEQIYLSYLRQSFLKLQQKMYISLFFKDQSPVSSGTFLFVYSSPGRLQPPRHNEYIYIYKEKTW